MLERFSHWLRRPGPGRLRPHAPHVAALAEQPAFPPALPQPLPGSVYEQSPAVYMAVNRIAEAGALVPLNIYRLAGEQRLAVENHPLERLLAAPNPYLSRFELLEQTLGMLELHGNAYWFIVGDAAGRPAELWPLRPDRVTIVPDVEHYVRGYVYTTGSRQIPLDALEVIHFKRWHPANDYYGLSALAAARLAILSDRAMAQWNYNTFGRDNGIPAGIVSIRDYVNDGDFERIKEEWRTSYGGAKRRTAFLRGSSIQWQNIGLSHTDLDFLQGRKSHRDEILNLFGIPVGLVSENATEANAKVAERLFIERTLYPRLVRLAQKISAELLPFYPGEHVAMFDDIRPTDHHARLAEIRTAHSILSVNEIRQKYYALPPVAWGEVPPARLAPVAPAAATPAATPTATPAEPAAAHKSALDELTAWERFALRRLEKGSRRAFTVHTLPEDLAFEISARLLAATDRDSIRAVFQQARAGLSEGPAAPLAE
ncbi:MAG: phage portal protein [Anaerolineae bacterium]|nr:phage portal protein [Anaerolineae bacterium]